MPTFSAIQLDRFLEPGATTTTAKTTSLKSRNGNEILLEDAAPRLERRNTTSFSSPAPPFRRTVAGDVPPPHPQLRRRNSVASSPQFNHVTVRPPITPALYATPEPTPLPESPMSSFPPSSPFLINHKRRVPRLSKSLSEADVTAEVGHVRSLSEENLSTERNLDAFNVAVEKVNGDGDGGRGVVKVEEDEAKVKAKAVGGGGVEREVSESDDFFDPQESMSFSSSVDAEDCSGAERSARASTPMGEFYDAWDELSSDSGQQGAQRSLSDVEVELREMRLTLLMEIEKRKQVEESVHSMQSQWQMLREKLGTVGVVLPADLAVSGECNLLDTSLADNICQQIYLARFVSESVGRGIARAEVEAEMEAQLEVKNFEMARLFDRLHYYETVNREMSQRNQEAVEIARRERQKRRRRQKWVWGSIATAITLGSAALAWSYLPGGNTSSTTKSADTSESSSDAQ